MKVLTLTALLFPFTILSNPITLPETSPNPVNVLEARDNRCTQVSGSPQGCDWDPWRSSRRTTVPAGWSFDVSCVTTGQAVNGYTTWDWVPDWGCWIWAGWTNAACESNFNAATMEKTLY